jgi:hypothetical protein
MRSLLSKLIPFVLFGFVLVALVAGFILFSYLLIFGALVGLVLFLISWIREKFFPSKHLTTRQSPPKSGRTFDHKE